MHPEVAGEVFTALGLDVVNLHRAKRLDPRDFQALAVTCRTPRQSEAALKLLRFHRIQEANLVGEDPSVTGRLDAQCPDALTVGARVALEAGP